MAKPKYDKLTTLLSIGVDLTEGVGEQVIGPCPFCKHRGEDGKKNYFYFNRETGQWDCKACGKTGNLFTFLTRYMAILNKETHMRDWTRIQHQRGGKIPWTEYKRHGLGWTGDSWLIPQFNAKGTVVSLLRWDGSHCRVVQGLNWDMFGMRELEASANAVGSDQWVWVMEGWSDFIAWDWYVKTAGLDKHVVIGMPSASVFKNAWAARFSGRNMRFVPDNDTAGDEMSEKVFKLLRGSPKVMQFVAWPDHRKTGYDARDYVNENEEAGIDPREAIEALEAITNPTPFRHEKILVSANALPGDIPADAASFADVMAVYKKWLRVDEDFETAAALCLGICLTDNLHDSPIWLYVIGPPSSGKTEILMSLQGSERVVYQSSMSQHSLVSGWNSTPDPSLLPKFNHRTAVFKDGTSLLTMHPEAKKEIYSVLRDAYDGELIKVYGHLTRHYTDLHFSILIGVTEAIYADSQASMGDRFLKFYMPQSHADREAKTYSAVERVSGKFVVDIEMKKELNTVVARFLSRKLDPDNLIPINPKYTDRIVSLALMIELLRATVEREAFDTGVLKYKPAWGVGGRVGIQLAKLAHALIHVYNLPDINEEIYAKILRVGEDTCTAMNIEIINVIVMLGNKGTPSPEIARILGYPTPTVTKRVNDMKQLGALEVVLSEGDRQLEAAGGKPTKNVFRLTPYLLDLYQRSRPDQPKTPPKRIAVNGHAPKPQEMPLPSLIGHVSSKKLPRVTLHPEMQENAV